MSVLQTQLHKKDIPGGLGGDVLVTNPSADDCVTPLGTNIGPGQTKRLTDYEWRLIPTATRTALGLTSAAA